MKQKETIQLGITGVLVIILMMSIGRALHKKKKHPKLSSSAEVTTPAAQPLSPAAGGASPQQATAAAATSSAPKPTLQSSAAFYAQLEKETATMELVRDPFSKQQVATASTPTTKGKTTSLQLNGIAWDEQHPTAIINNEITEVGSQIDEYTVVDIKKDRVILSDGEKNLILTIGL